MPHILQSEPLWISKEQVLWLHEQSLARHGGPSGIRSMSMLESALARAENYYAYGERNLFYLAAAYAVGIARNHAFIDGNKRTAYIVGGLFLSANGFRLVTHSTRQSIAFFESLAAGEVTIEEVAVFYEENTFSMLKE